MDDLTELIGAICFIAGQYSILFFVNYFGQKLTDCSFLMFDKV